MTSRLPTLALLLSLGLTSAFADLKKELKYEGDRANVKASDNGKFRVEVTGRRSRDVVEGRLPGEPLRVSMEDIDGDRRPEVIFVVRTDYRRKSAILVAWTWDGYRLRSRYIPPLDSYWRRIYFGGDEYEIGGGRVTRRFNTDPRGKDRVKVWLDLRRGTWRDR